MPWLWFITATIQATAAGCFVHYHQYDVAVLCGLMCIVSVGEGIARKIK